MSQSLEHEQWIKDNSDSMFYCPNFNATLPKTICQLRQAKVEKSPKSRDKCKFCGGFKDPIITWPTDSPIYKPINFGEFLPHECYSIQTRSGRHGCE